MGGNNSKSKTRGSSSRQTQGVASCSTSYHQEDVSVERHSSKKSESYCQEYAQWLKKQSETRHSSVQAPQDRRTTEHSFGIETIRSLPGHDNSLGTRHSSVQAPQDRRTKEHSSGIETICSLPGHDNSSGTRHSSVQAPQDRRTKEHSSGIETICSLPGHDNSSGTRHSSVQAPQDRRTTEHSFGIETIRSLPGHDYSLGTRHSSVQAPQDRRSKEHSSGIETIHSLPGHDNSSGTRHSSVQAPQDRRTKEHSSGIETIRSLPGHDNSLGTRHSSVQAPQDRRTKEHSSGIETIHSLPGHDNSLGTRHSSVQAPQDRRSKEHSSGIETIYSLPGHDNSSGTHHSSVLTPQDRRSMEHDSSLGTHLNSSDRKVQRPPDRENNGHLSGIQITSLQQNIMHHGEQDIINSNKDKIKVKRCDIGKERRLHKESCECDVFREKRQNIDYTKEGEEKETRDGISHAGGEDNVHDDGDDSNDCHHTVHDDDCGNGNAGDSNGGSNEDDIDISGDGDGGSKKDDNIGDGGDVDVSGNVGGGGVDISGGGGRGVDISNREEIHEEEVVVVVKEDDSDFEGEREVAEEAKEEEFSGTMSENDTSEEILKRQNQHSRTTALGILSQGHEREEQKSSSNADSIQKQACKNTEVLVKITLPAAMDWQVVSDDLKQILKYIKFKPLKTNFRQHKDNFCISFSERKQAEKAMEIIRTRRKQIKIMDCQTVIDMCRKEILDDKQKALTNHQFKCNEITQQLTSQAGNKNSKKPKFHSFEVHEKLAVLEQKAKELNGQLTEFMRVTNQLIARLESLQTIQNEDVSPKLKEIRQCFQREKVRIDSALPIYAEKSRIVDIVQEHQVCIILGETGSGKSTQIVQYLYDAGFAEKGNIVCTQPRKVAAFSLAKRVSEELLDNKLVDCLEGTKRAKQRSKILFTTDHLLLMKCIKDQDLSQFSCVVIDEAHERSIYTDLLLGIIKKALPKRPDLRVIVTSATIDPSLFQDYFAGCPVIRVSGKLFPVEVEWKRKQQGDSKLDHSKDYVKEAVDKVVEIHQTSGPGDILVFLTCAAEIDRACTSISSKIKTNDLICLPLHGKLQQEDQRKVFDPTPVGKRKVVFSTNCAETSLTIPGIKFVVDSGRAKEMKYDPKRNLNSLELAIISQSSANQRMGRAGRTDSGKCVRLYTQEDFYEMDKSSKPEILRVHLGQALLKLAELGITNPAYFDYVQSPPLDSIETAMSELVELEAIKDGELTELGRKMARVPVDPRLAKFLFEGLKAGVGYEALVLVSVATVNGSVFFRMGTDQEKREADKKKFEFCHLGGDFMTLLDVFRAWRTIDERDRGRWCYEKSLNAKAMRMANETLKDLKTTLKRELHIHDIPVSTRFDRETTDAILLKILFSCFLTKLCVFTGHEKAGYQSVIGGHQVKVHPSSALKFMGKYPKFVVYEKILKTSQDFMLNVTPIEETSLKETITDASLLCKVDELVDNMMVMHVITCSETLINKTLLPFRDKMPLLESRVSKSCNGTPVVIEVDKKCGNVKLFISAMYADTGKSIVQNYLDKGRKELRDDTAEYDVESSSSLRVVMQSGFTVQQVLMPGMYRSVVVGKIPRNLENFYDFLNIFGNVIDISPVVKQQVFVTYEKPEEAATAVQSYQLFVEQDFSIWPKLNKHQKKANFNFSVRMNWLRRQPNGMATVSFEKSCITDVPWADFPFRWSQKLQIGCKTATVTADKFRPNSIFIRNLDLSSTKMDIERALLQLFPDIPVEHSDIFIQYKQRDRDSIDTESQKTALDNIISQYAAPGTYDVSIKEFSPQHNKCVSATAWVNFSSPNEGIKVSQNLKYKHCEGLERWPVTLDIHPRLDFYYTSLKQVYDLVKGVVQEQIGEIANVCHQECEETLDLKETAFGTPNLGRVKLSVETKCLRHYLDSLAAISRAIQGETFDCSKTQERKMLLDSSGRDLLTKIQKETGALIRPDERKMSLIIYGTSLQKETALEAINKFVFQLALSESSVWEVKLKAQGKPRGLLKRIMSTFGVDLERLCDIEGVSKVSKCIFKHTLTIHSTDDAKIVVLQRIEEIEKLLSTQTQVQEACDTESEECSTCFCDFEGSSYKLAICGHAYCTDCVTRQLQQAQFPMACTHEDCTELFALKDIQNLVRDNDLLNKTVKKAIDSYLDKNQDKARPCPSPDCPMVYLVTADEKSFRCDVCFASTCTSCHKPYHLGMTCNEYEIDLKDPGGKEFEKWMKEKPLERKRCPGCRRPVEKMAGCSHMHCSKCNQHYCWDCMNVFPSSDDVYKHQAACPGN